MGGVVGAEGDVAEAEGGVDAEAGDAAEHLEAGFEVENGASRGKPGHDHKGALLLGGGLVVFLLLLFVVGGSLTSTLWRRRRREMGSLSLPPAHVVAEREKKRLFLTFSGAWEGRRKAFSRLAYAAHLPPSNNESTRSKNRG